MGRMWLYRGFRVWSMCSTLMDQGWLASLISSLVIQLDALFIRSVRTINKISFHQRHRSRSSLHSFLSFSFISAKNQIWWKIPLKLAPVMSRILLPKLRFVVCTPPEWEDLKFAQTYFFLQYLKIFFLKLCSWKDSSCSSVLNSLSLNLSINQFSLLICAFNVGIAWCYIGNHFNLVVMSILDVYWLINWICNLTLKKFIFQNTI